jgi:TRAP transporter TAXI family solute receptor
MTVIFMSPTLPSAARSRFRRLDSGHLTSMSGGRRAALAVIAGAIALASCSPNDPPGGGDRLSIATGGSGGVYQVLGGGLADLMSDELPDGPTTAETTSASVDNLILVANGESDVAFTLSDTAIDAVKGQAGFDRPLPLRALATLYPNIPQVVVKADSGIETIEELRDKAVSVGAPNSGTEVVALRLLEVAGVDPDEDIKRRQMGVGESVAAMRDGTIDAFFWSGGVPTGAVTDLATTDDIRILDVERYLPEMRSRYGEAYMPAETEEGDYAGVPPVKTIGVPNLLMVNADMNEDLAYRITRLLFDGKDRLAQVHQSAEKLEPGTASKVVEPVQLHPGAQRYYGEAAR